MKGIQFVTDAEGKKTGVLIDLREHGMSWEDFCDCHYAHERTQERREAWQSVKYRLELARQIAPRKK